MDRTRSERSSVAAFSAVGATERKGGKGGQKGGQGKGEIKMPTPVFRTEVPMHPLDLILGCSRNKLHPIAALAAAYKLTGEGRYAFAPRKFYTGFTILVGKRIPALRCRRLIRCNR